MISFQCSSCRQPLFVAEQDCGTIGWCPGCNTPYTAPRPAVPAGTMPVSVMPARLMPVSSMPSATMRWRPPPPPPITVPKPLWICLMIIGGAMLIGFLYAVIDSTRSHLPAESRADDSHSVVLPRSTPPSASGPQRPEADVDGQPWTFDPVVKTQSLMPITARYAQKLPTDGFAVSPEACGGTVYFGTPTGKFFAVNAQTLQVEKHKLGNAFYGFSRDGSTLKAALQQPMKYQAIAQIDEPMESGDVENVACDGRKLGGKELPNDWLMPSPTVYFRGRYYSCAYGSVKVFDKGVASEFKSPLQNLKFWRIALLPTGPAGYDNDGVFELDEHLCPIKRIINLRNNPNDRQVSAALASDGKTLCFYSPSVKYTWLQIWSLDGRNKLREIDVNCQFADWTTLSPNERSRLLVVGRGYLFSGHDLTWLSAESDRPVQYSAPIPRLNPDLGPLERQYMEKAAKAKVFTPAVLVNNRVFVGHADGGLYVFDASTFSRPQQ